MALLRKSAKQGFFLSMRFLSHIYRECGGENIRLAAYWMERAAEIGEPQCMYDTGVLYESLGDEESMEMAFGWFGKAAEAGFPEAMYELSEMYRSGKGTEQDPDKSAEWLEKAKTAEPYELLQGKYFE